MSMVGRSFFAITVAVLMVASASRARAYVIDFEGFAGPTAFVAAGNAQTLIIRTPIGDVTVSGGVILTDAANLPADETSVYGTAGNASNIGVTTGSGFT